MSSLNKKTKTSIRLPPINAGALGGVRAGTFLTSELLGSIVQVMIRETASRVSLEFTKSGASICSVSVSMYFRMATFTCNTNTHLHRSVRGWMAVTRTDTAIITMQTHMRMSTNVHSEHKTRVDTLQIIKSNILMNHCEKIVKLNILYIHALKLMTKEIMNANIQRRLHNRFLPSFHHFISCLSKSTSQGPELPPNH